MRGVPASAAALLLLGCAAFSPKRGHDHVDAIVQERLGVSTGWGEGEPAAEDIAQRVDVLLDELLDGGLTRERAVAIALLNNPDIQATYAGLGISQADLVQAGRLSNPVLAGSLGFPFGPREGERIEYEVSIAQSFLDLLVLPLRNRIAGEQFIADTLRVASEALALAATVSQAFARYEATERVLVLERLLVNVAMSAAAEMEARFRAGNEPRLALDSERVLYEEARLSLARAELEHLQAREALDRSLGLWGHRTVWELAPESTDLPSDEPPLDDLEQLAIRQRLDIDAARKQVLLMHNAVDLAKTTRFFGLIEVGVHVHQDPDGPRLFGPTLALELPIFDQRQATIARLEAQRSQAEHRLQSLSIQTRASVRSASGRLLGLRQMAEHQKSVVLPLRKRIVEETQRHFNAMQVGLAELLNARRGQVLAEIEHVGTVRDYWIVRAELERLVGGSLRPSPMHPRPVESRGEGHRERREETAP